MKIGSTVRSTQILDICDIGEIGVCVNFSWVAGHPSYYILFRDGGHDWFTDNKVEQTLEFLGECEELKDYSFKSVFELGKDFAEEVFDVSLYPEKIGKRT